MTLNALIDPNNPYSRWVFLVLSIWSIIWKGIALWKASKNSQKYWFIALLIVNTIGIVEIVYLKFFQKDLSILEPEVITPSKKFHKTKRVTS